MITDPRERRAAIVALMEGATTDGERTAAKAALRRHDARYHPDGVPEQGDPGASVPGLGFVRGGWIAGDVKSHAYMATGVTPAGEWVTLAATLRHGGRPCVGCGGTTGRMWRTLVQVTDGHSEDRICLECLPLRGKPPSRLTDRGEA